MKSLFLAAASFLGIISSSFAQSPDPAYGKMVRVITTHFNNAYYDSIWHLCSAELKSQVSKEKVIDFLGGIYSQLGKIEHSSYDHSKKEMATYKVTFEHGVLALNFVLDKEHKFAAITFTPFVSADLPTMERNKTSLRLPFNGEWTVFWGGDTKEQNYHVSTPAQKNAMDILIMDKSGKSYKTDGKTNEDYYAFGQPLLAPCDAEVIQAVDGIKDNKPGDMNPVYLTGNSIMLKTANNEYILFAHFKNHSIKVKEGEKVKQGQVLGECGNSGNSSEPHLHFHIENVEDMSVATGVKCYFESIVVNGTAKNDYSPVKGDIVSNVKK